MIQPRNKILISLNQQLKDKLKLYVDSTETSMSSLIRDLIASFIQKNEKKKRT
jgi:metal-responsive CopG/Arc/MetJ family transcriptional regulator